MAERPWTCIYVSGGKTLLVTEIAGLDHQAAYDTLRHSHPGYDLRAMIPGDHACASSAIDVHRPDGGSSERFTDPFDPGGFPE